MRYNREMTVKRKKEQVFPSYNDIVFEHRNKDYGGYQIRSTYQYSLKLSFFIVLIFILVATIIVYFWKINPILEWSEKGANNTFKSVEYTHERLPLPNQVPFLNTNKTPTVKTLAKDINAVKPIAKSEIHYKAQSKEYKPINPEIDTSQKKLLADLVLRHKNNVQKEKLIHEDSILLVLEKLPQFPGGLPAVQSYFNRKQHYPMNALLKGVQGSVLISFVVNKQGGVEMAKVAEGVDPELDWEAVRLVNTMPQWQPGYYRGKPIACMVIMPVDFRIK